jgi:hypothetical protein
MSSGIVTEPISRVKASTRRRKVTQRATRPSSLVGLGHIGARVRIIGQQPAFDSDTSATPRGDGEPPPAQGCRGDHRGHRPDAEAGVSATDLGTALDQDDTEFAANATDIGDEPLIALFENVQRDHCTGKQHARQGKHREAGHHPSIVVAAPPPEKVRSDSG